MIIMADTGEVWTFGDVRNYSNKIANWATKCRGFSKGDVVALVLTNRPEFVAIQMGLAKVGVISALINCNLKGEVKL